MDAWESCYVCDFYPRSPCGERRRTKTVAAEVGNFYPRSPCGERHFAGSAWVSEFPISIHALLAESDAGLIFFLCVVSLFLSTLSLRRATTPLTSRMTRRQYFYPRSPCGERQDGTQQNGRKNRISIHALLAESDCKINTRGSKKMISIHALLAESDAALGQVVSSKLHFYPRSPCGERPRSPFG